MHAIMPIIHCIIMLISWHHKNLGICGLGVAQAPRLVMKSEFTTTSLRMCTEHVAGFYWRALTCKQDEVEFAHCYLYIQQNFPVLLQDTSQSLVYQPYMDKSVEKLIY